MNTTHNPGTALLAIVSATLVACGGAEPAPAASASALGAPAPAYLALGDSVPFGDNPLLYPPAPDTPNWFVGYPTYLGDLIDTPVVNAACPGQTSSGFLDLGGTDTGCFSPWRSDYGLHISYDGTQFAFAQQFLAGHRNTRLVTIHLGSNDMFLVFAECGGDFGCVLERAPEAINDIAANVTYAVASLRDSGYRGQLIVVLYYAAQTDPTYRMLAEYLNAGLAAAAAAGGADVVDLLAAFDAATPPPDHDACAAGLLIPLPGGGCDQHPSEAGHRLIARAIAEAVAARPE